MTSPNLNRRQALSFLLGGAAAVTLAGCTQGEADEAVVLDSFYESGEGRQAVLDAVAATGMADLVRIGTTSRETFISSIDDYLAFAPGSVFTWPTGSALADLIRNGGVEQVSHAWTSSDLNPRLRRLSSDNSGVQYMVPLWFDPVGFFYSRTAWADAGYSPPATPAEVLSLAETMASDGVSAFGMSRLATPALVSLFDYLALAEHGVVDYRQAITAVGSDLTEFGAQIFPMIQTLADIEAGLDDGAPVLIVPARLSEAVARVGDGEELDSFILGERNVIAHCEGLMLAQASEEASLARSKQLIAEFAKIDAQQAFLGTESAFLPANLNANYQAMSATMLGMVEIIDRAQDLVESSEASPPSRLAELSNQLIAIVRP